MNEPNISSLSTINGGEPFSVSKRDGTIESVFVKQLPVRLYPKFLEAQDDEVKMIALACHKPEEFADSITPESHEALVGVIEKVNGDFFQRWVARRMDRTERIVPGLRAKVMAAKMGSPTT